MSNIVPFGSTCKLQNGRAFKPEEWSSSGTPIIRIQNLTDESKPFNYCDFEVEDRFHVNSGDLLFSWSGTPGTSFGAFFWNRGKGFLNQHIFRVDLDVKRVDKNYLRYAINSKLNFIIDQAHGGVGLKHITKGKLEAIEIPLPPLPEQKRIAAILDKADAIRRKRQQAIQLADDFLRAVFLDMFGDPVTNPKGWEVKTVTELIRNGVILQVQDGNHGNDHPKVSDFSEDGIPFVTANVVRKGKILFEQCYYLDRTWLDKLRIGFAKPRDVLISHKGSLGFTAVLDDTYEDYIFSPQTTYYRVNEEKLMPEYLKGYFDSGFFQQLFAKEGIQSTRAYLGITRQKELPIMIPTMSEQLEYVQMLSKYEELSRKLFEPKDFSGLFSSLSQKAFSGLL